jgi:hypothetical protein
VVRTVLTALLTVAVAVTLVALYTRYLGGKTGATITSWWRSPFHNEEVGGRPGSLHVLGWAVDLTPATKEIEDAARAVGFPVVVNEGNHIHASWWQS